MATMIDIATRNMEVTDRINEYVQKRVGKLDKFITGVEQTRIDLAYNKSARNASDRQVAQITVHGKGFILRVEERAADIYTAIDAAVDKMQRQMERYKGKRYRNRVTGGPMRETAPEEEMELEEELPAIVRRKSFTLSPMNEMEAIEQMALVGHENFFVFFNVDTNSINVIYRRREGDYGLIDPRLP